MLQAAGVMYAGNEKLTSYEAGLEEDPKSGERAR